MFSDRRSSDVPETVFNCSLRVQSERNVGVGEALTIESVMRQDGGLYVCTADNGAGSKSRDVTVDVKCMSCEECVRRPCSCSSV